MVLSVGGVYVPNSESYSLDPLCSFSSTEFDSSTSSHGWTIGQLWPPPYHLFLWLFHVEVSFFLYTSLFFLCPTLVRTEPRDSCVLDEAYITEPYNQGGTPPQFFVLLYFVLFWGRVLLYPRLIWNSFSSPGWPWTHSLFLSQPLKS